MKILVKSTNSESPAEEKTVSATTWGELKAELQISGDMKGIIAETKVTLENDNAVLPTGIGKHRVGVKRGQPNGFDFTIYLTPSKVSSGVKSVVTTAKEISTKFNNIAEVESHRRRFKKLLNEVLENLREDAIETPKVVSAKKAVTKKSSISQEELDAIDEDMQNIF